VGALGQSGGSFPSDVAFSLQGVGKAFLSREGVRVRAVDGVSLEAPRGKITCVVGPTGSGKSTILRIVSGLETPDDGSVRVGGALPRELQGKIAYLSQRHTLLPWLRVRDNVGLPLELRGVTRDEREGRVRGICGILGLDGAEEMYPHELSGGMQQRASLGRLLAAGSPYWLMDEPFSALDEKTLHRLQALLLDIVHDTGVSVLFVTHSIDEAVFLADRIVVLSASPGRVVDLFEPGLAHPRDRVSSEYGGLIEAIRTKIESVLKEP